MAAQPEPEKEPERKRERPVPRISGQAYLTYTGEGLRRIGGVGEFSKNLPALPVSTSIAVQYDTPEMRELGWVVSARPKNAIVAPPPTPDSVPTTEAEAKTGAKAGGK